DPIPNSEVKPFSADDSVAVCHAKVGNCQALKLKTQASCLGFFLPVVSVQWDGDCPLLSSNSHRKTGGKIYRLDACIGV
ncbi:MAG: hypothetical protein Q8Q50_06470, partial [Methylobacter sp.]|nr:hypothetical protein [Methylobacter sp.]